MEQGPRAARSSRGAPARQAPRPARRMAAPTGDPRRQTGAAVPTRSKVAGRARPQGRSLAGPSSLPPPLSPHRGAHLPGRARCPWRRELTGARRRQARDRCAQGRGTGAAMTGDPAPAPIGQRRRKGRGEGTLPGSGRARPEVRVALLGVCSCGAGT